MSWLSNFIRPKIRSIVNNQKDVPDNLWQKCPECDGMLFSKDLKDALYVCHHCDHHLYQPVEDRMEMLFDNGKFETVRVAKSPVDPLKFKDRRKYTERLREAQVKTKRQDAIVVCKGSIMGQKTVVTAFDFSFMGGSMGAAVGAGIVQGAKTAIKEKAAYIVVPASGGARMQEGAISLMQMPRTTVALQMLKEVGLPYIVILTHPTTGGVSASFAMLGDVHIAEPKAMIGFAGKRVIQETIREQLPDDFQTSEYLLEHGMVDMVTPRSELRDTLGTLINILMKNSEPKRKKKPLIKDKKDKKDKSSSRDISSVTSIEDKARVVAFKKPTSALDSVAEPLKKIARQ